LVLLIKYRDEIPLSTGDM